MFKPKTKAESIVFPIVLVIFLIYTVTLIYPFIWLFLNSFKTNAEFRSDTFGLPIRWIFANYYDAITYTYNGINILQMFVNSLINIVIVVVPDMFLACCTSYVLAKYKFKGRKLIFDIALIIMIIPTVGGTAATYSFFHDIGIFDSYFSLLLMAASGFGTGFLLLYSTFSNLSWTYAEAGFIDGASHFRVFISLMLPQVLPVIVSLMIITTIGVWNDYYTPYMYLPTKPTIAVGLSEIEANATSKDQYPLLFALMLLSIVPVLLLFVFMQNTIMENVTAGGIKG